MKANAYFPVDAELVGDLEGVLDSLGLLLGPLALASVLLTGRLRIVERGRLGLGICALGVAAADLGIRRKFDRRVGRLPGRV